MDIQDGKQIEKMLVGEVRNPASEEDLIRQGVDIIARKEGVKKTRGQIESLILHIKRLPNKDKDRKLVFRTAIEPIRDRIYSNIPHEFEAVRRDQDYEESYVPSRPFAERLIGDIEGKIDDIMFKPDSEGGDQLYRVHLFTAIGSELDHAVNVDFWVELRDAKTEEVIVRNQVDIKTNPNDRGVKGMAGLNYLFESEQYLDESRKDKINPNAYKDIEYTNLLDTIVHNFRNAIQPEISIDTYTNSQFRDNRGESEEDEHRSA